MRRSQRVEAVIQSSGPNLKANDVSDELTSAWKGLAQSKAALRQIENKLEAGPGSGVLLESIKVPSKKKSLKKDQSKDGQQCDQKEKNTKMRGRSSQSPEKCNTRGPLQNSTQENTTRNSVEFREPLASYREATPQPHPSSPPDLSSLQSAPGSSYSSQPSNSNSALSHLVYQRDTRDKQTDRDLDSTHSSTMERMEIRYLNDLPALDTIRTNLPHSRALTREALQSNSFLKAQLLQSTDSKDSGSTPSTSPGSASQRLENLRRHQPDDKLEKLKERIRKQRQHLEETAEKEKSGSYLEQPLITNGNCGTCTIPTVKVRKVATAPSAPIYKGFNSTETKIQTPDGKIWHEEDFHNFSREIYKDLSRQFEESTKSQLQRGQRDLSKERKPHKPVRKVQKIAPASEFAKPVISPASWREGQKLVKMVLGKDPTVTTEVFQKTRRKNQKGPHYRSSSDPCAELNRPKCPQNTAKKQESNEFQNNAKTSSTAVQEPSPVRVGTDMLSVDIKGILDDLQLECKTTESSERARGTSRRGASHRQGRGSSGSRTRASVSTWTTTSTRVCRSASPSNQSRAVNRVEAGQKKRHYDADTVRQYIAQQQEKRKRQQVEERNALRQEAEKRQQRLQELYRKQREVAKTVATSTAAPAQMQLQETFNKLLLEGAQLKQEAAQMKPMYQPSGESDKENIRLEQAQSPSSSDRSLNHPPVSRNDFAFEEASSAHLEHLIPTTQPVTGPVCSNEHLLSQLLRLESAIAASEKQTKRHNTAPTHSPDKMSRIEALKATAMSLSNRIESEASKLAGEGFNYGLTTAVDMDTILAPRSSHTCGAIESENMAFSTERMSGARTMYSWTGFPEQDFVLFKASTEKNGRVNSWTCPKSSSVPHNVFFQDTKWLANDVEENPKTNRQQYEALCIDGKHPDGHDSSGSISEGPLSEGSVIDGNHSPPPLANAFRPIGHQGAMQHSVRKSHQHLSEFQKDAEKCAALTSLLAHQENSKPAWEEFNKGSPLSVINIFTKSLQGNVKAGDIYSERNSPAHLLPSGSHVTDLHYENDFVSTQGSGASGQRDVNALSSNNHNEELLRRSTGDSTHNSSVHSPQRSSCSTPGSSPRSKNSNKIRSKISDQSDATLMEEHRSSPPSEVLSSEYRKRDFKRSSEHSQMTSDDISGLSHQSSDVVKKMSPPSKVRQSPLGSLEHSSVESDSFSEPFRRSSPEKAANTNTAAYSGSAEVKASGQLQYSPAVLQQRLAAELHYLESIEESVRQLGDIERLMGVSVAQHESASLAQMLKAKQQHEQELYELKIKTEREALETRLQMEENRQRVAQAHIELQEGLAATHKETLEGLQEATTKMMSQQAEAARYTADTARHIKEMTEMAHAHLITYNPASVHTSELLKEKPHSRTKDKVNLSYESSRTLTDDHHSNHSDSESIRSLGLSLSSEHKERVHEPPKKSKSDGAEGSISIEDEVPAAANESLCSNGILSAVEEKGDTTSVATEYSHKFEDSITEDEIEERSFRSLLPSEAHRRESLDKKLQHHDESEEDGACHNGTPALVAHNMLKHQEVFSAFSGGKDSFSHFTMEMVRQHMRDEEVRLQHQSALLRLRHKALKEKTRTELAWLEHQKRKLRDKGEDDKMPPLKKKQRGLLLKLQQEQAEIKRLQEANKAARKERQLLLKQQEEIERMRSSTLKLKERLRSATTEAPSEASLSEVAFSNLENTDLNVRSPSPSVSVSGSETSSIMQKLKKMRSQMDEKFLTKREQQLMQRRRHAEELLQWKQRLDQEEAEVRKMEKKALAAWDEKTSSNKGHDLSESEKDFNTSQKQKGDADLSSATPESSIHTDVDPQQEETSIQSSPANYTDDFTSISPSPNRQSAQKSTVKGSVDASPSEHDHISKQRDTTGSAITKQTEHISDQSDIENRIRALKEELKKRKFTAYQLKKEQKKRTKERLKAKEANLLKQLETYDDFIEKTKAELKKQPYSTPDTTSQVTDVVSHNTEHSSDKTRHRKTSESVHKALSDQSRSTSMNSTISDEEPPTVTSTPRPDSPDLTLTPKNTQAQAQESLHHSVTSEHESEMQKELKLEISKLSEDQDSKYLLKLDRENKMNTASEFINRQSPSFSQELEPSRPPPAPIDGFVAADLPTHISSSPLSHEETSKKDSKLSHPLANSYDTFESSVDTLLRENNSAVQPAAEKSFKDSDQTSLKKDVPARAAGYDSHEEEIEEEIPKDLSGLSVASNHSHQFIDVLDAQVKEELKADSRNTEDTNHLASVTPVVTDEMPCFCIGDRVVVSGVQPGTLRFKGSTSFANGFWAGVELDKSEGSNNGTYDGVLYFECAEKHGIFAPPDKVTHLTDKFEMYMDTTEDDDSFHDDMSEEENQQHQTKEPRSQTEHFGNNLMYLRDLGSGDTKSAHDLQQLDNTLYNSEPHEHPVLNGTSIWGFEDVSPTPLIENNEKVHLSTQAKKEVTNLVEKLDVELNHQLVVSSDLKSDEGLKDKLGSLADKMLDNFVKDTVLQFAELKKSKAKKIHDACQTNGNVFEGVEAALASSVDQKDDLPFFLTQEKEEMSSPDLCNRPESPVLGLSGQEELAKRLAELELSRELDVFGDDQDWFDEDYGLSSRREQQRLKQKQREEEEQVKLGGHFGKTVPSPGDQEVKTPPRPELPHPMPPKLPEEPAMVVPHSAAEIEKMTHAAALEIWKTCGLEEGATALTQQQKPNPSQEYIGEEPSSEDQEAVCLHSYKKAVFDLTWEILQDIFAEDPNVDQPQWVKPQRVKSSSFHKVRTAGEISRIQKFVTTEVLKLYGLAKDQYQRTDWPKMLKFGRKKRDRVDNILVQELHEEESQWVNYDEDELFVKMQLADSIFDALLKDTANVLTQIYDKRARRESVS
ncbi:centrosome-associated protein 350 isoform X2 [Boleophthalmus pectinirostris]|uniref:centrosome-associated protein 350 isoform X2 n=1 Tax=Boleophthalmus pectinirostris TaxID=150288 RepID=UPI00242F998A|nr:centrosome-associated protein 350 isoform X2 [Boleophthalmus pectinirostris]